MSVTPTKDGRHTESKKIILGCAREIYLKGGLEAVSMRKVAQRAGLSATAIYRHYQDKDEMLKYMVADSFRVFEQYLLASYTPGDVHNNFKKGIEAYKKFALKQSMHYRLIFMANNVTAFKNPPAELVKYSSSTFDFLVDRIQETIDAKIIRPMNARELAIQLWSFMHGLVSLYLMGQFKLTRSQFDEHYQSSINNFIEGIKNA